MMILKEIVSVIAEMFRRNHTLIKEKLTHLAEILFRLTDLAKKHYSFRELNWVHYHDSSLQKPTDVYRFFLEKLLKERYWDAQLTEWKNVFEFDMADPEYSEHLHTFTELTGNTVLITTWAQQAKFEDVIPIAKKSSIKEQLYAIAGKKETWITMEYAQAMKILDETRSFKLFEAFFLKINQSHLMFGL
jgi:hypothetical protein